MSKQPHEAACCLCGKPTIYVETDHANCRFYQCESEDCGYIEISLRALPRLEHNPQLRAQLSTKGREVRPKGQVVRVVVDSPSQQLNVSIVGGAEVK